MMKLLVLSLSAVVVVVASSSSSSSSSEEKSPIVVQEVADLLKWDVDALTTEVLAKYKTLKHHFDDDNVFDIPEALRNAKHEDVMAASTAFRGLQAQHGKGENDDDDEKKCDKCVYSASQWIQNQTVAYLSNWCPEKPHSSYVRQLCSAYKTHPKVVEGFLFGDTGARTSGAAYCVGIKECPMPKLLSGGMVSPLANPLCGKDDTNAVGLAWLDVLTDYDWISYKEDYAFSKAAANLHNFVSPQQCDCGDDRVPSFISKTDLSHHTDKPNCDCVCQGCLHHMTKYVLSTTVYKIQNLCSEGSACPNIKKLCDWVKKNKEEAVGFLFAKTQPWDKAVGWCYGAGRCTTVITPPEGKSQHATSVVA